MFNVILHYYNVYPLLCVQSYNQAHRCICFVKRKNLKRIIRGKNRYSLKMCTKPIAQGCKLWPCHLRIAWFLIKYILNCSLCLKLSTHQVSATNVPWTDEIMCTISNNAGKHWGKVSAPYLLSKHVDLPFLCGSQNREW